jgi:hypothetical protein
MAVDETSRRALELALPNSQRHLHSTRRRVFHRPTDRNSDADAMVELRRRVKTPVSTSRFAEVREARVLPNAGTISVFDFSGSPRSRDVGLPPTMD